MHRARFIIQQLFGPLQLLSERLPVLCNAEQHFLRAVIGGFSRKVKAAHGTLPTFLWIAWHGDSPSLLHCINARGSQSLQYHFTPNMASALRKQIFSLSAGDKVIASSTTMVE